MSEREVCDEILQIMETYDRQLEREHWGVDTPGGLEHMGDVWRLLDKWRGKIMTGRALNPAREAEAKP
jgi:hypothetical protein